jgi:hypothetical protein
MRRKPMPMKRLRLITVFLTAVLVISLPAVGAAQDKKYAALLGTWDVKTEEGGREFVFEFFVKDDKLTGTFTGSSGTSAMANLTFEDNTVKFSVTVGNGMVIDFSAIVAEDQLSGTLSLQYGEASITGKRRK